MSNWFDLTNETKSTPVVSNRAERFQREPDRGEYNTEADASKTECIV